MNEPAFSLFAGPATWARMAAQRLADQLRAGIAARGAAVFAGSGGGTPGPIYDALAQAPLDWSRVVVTLVDERFVPEDSPDSNAALLRRRLLTGPAAEAEFIGLYTGALTPETAAIETTARLAGLGRLDAALLGMGEDGHILSMFPDSPVLPALLDPAAEPACFAVPAGEQGRPPPQPRLSLNLPWLLRTDAVVLAITGPEKRRVFDREWDADPVRAPLAALRAAGARLEVFWTEDSR